MSEIVTSQNGTDPKSGPDGGPEKKKKTKKLGHEELLRLLSVFEGELQGFGFLFFGLHFIIRTYFEVFEGLFRSLKTLKFFDDFEDVKKSTC